MSLQKLFLFLISLLLVPQVAAHPNHNSIGQLQYSAECDCFEVSLKLETESLEAALARHNKGVRKPLEATESDSLLTTYVSTQFRLRNSNLQAQQLRWVGKDIQPSVTWIYFTLTAKGDAFELNNRILITEEPSQINNVQIIGPESTKTLSFSIKNQSSWQRID
jgi:hypothetical protein